MPPRAFFSKDPSQHMSHQEKSTSATTLYARATLYDPKSIRAASSPLTRLLPAARPRGVRRPGMRGRQGFFGLPPPLSWHSESETTLPRRIQVQRLTGNAAPPGPRPPPALSRVVASFFTRTYLLRHTTLHETMTHLYANLASGSLGAWDLRGRTQVSLGHPGTRVSA